MLVGGCVGVDVQMGGVSERSCAWARVCNRVCVCVCARARVCVCLPNDVDA